MGDFKKSTVYQIYPKSFRDSNGDGWGDLRGVAEKLDYLKLLGVEYIWLTPFFVSPQKDNGYDVADYYRIDPRYGTMADLEYLAAEAEARGIRLMLDMVFNHTSDRHPWFQKALQGDKAYQDCYLFRPGKADGAPPTDWESKFGGSAWEYVPALDKYYLHLFDVSQPDLNWENPAVREEAAKIVNFWIGKGIKGFRFDVVNLISKGSFEDDPQGDGRRFYTDGPRVHAYLRELNMRTFGRDAEIITVGEMSSTTLENCCRYAAEGGGELSMVFNFHHLKVDFAGNEKWVLVPYDFMKLKRILFEWQCGMAAHCAWSAVFWCNHDQPRVVSRFGDEGRYHSLSAKMLATAVHCLRGTPFIYQGEELGMTNANFTDIAQYRDVESLNHFRILREKGMTEADAYRILQVHSRDNSRTPMQWSAGSNAGFTEGDPWISVNPNHTAINAARQTEEADSVFHHYRRLVQLRKEYDVIAYGDIQPLDETHPRIFAYRRTYHGTQLIVVNNFYGTETAWRCPADLRGFRLLLGNYPTPPAIAETLSLRPFESTVWYSG